MYADRSCLSGLAGQARTITDDPGWCVHGSGRGNVRLNTLRGYTTLGDPEARHSVSRICARSRRSDMPALGEVQQALGCPGMPKPRNIGEAHYRIVIGGRQSGCGDDSTIIACAQPDRSVHLNAEDWSFLSYEDGHVVFGTGLQEVDLLQVFLHETGHWIGLDHSEHTGSIMADYLTAASCLGQTDISELARAVDLGWDQRLGGYGALRGEAKRRSTAAPPQK